MTLQDLIEWSIEQDIGMRFWKVRHARWNDDPNGNTSMYFAGFERARGAAFQKEFQADTLEQLIEVINAAIQPLIVQTVKDKLNGTVKEYY